VIQDANAIYHEATYLHNDVEKATSRHHSTAVQAAQLALKANAGKLLLGHFSSKYKELEPFRDEAAAIFPNVMIAVEGVAYDL
jgi:ribonuclease Z